MQIQAPVLLHLRIKQKNERQIKMSFRETLRETMGARTRSIPA